MQNLEPAETITRGSHGADPVILVVDEGAEFAALSRMGKSSVTLDDLRDVHAAMRARRREVR